MATVDPTAEGKEKKPKCSKRDGHIRIELESLCEYDSRCAQRQGIFPRPLVACVRSKRRSTVDHAIKESSNIEPTLLSFSMLSLFDSPTAWRQIREDALA